MKYLFLLLVLTSCSTTRPQGSLTWSVSTEKHHPYCVYGKILYPQVTVNTNWQTGLQTAYYSWQCYVNDKDNNRYYHFLGNNFYKAPNE